MEQRLSGRHVVVTGAGTGIGRAIAERLAGEGAPLTLVARTRERLDATAAAVGGGVVAPADIRDRGQVEAAFELGVRGHGAIHALRCRATPVTPPRRPACSASCARWRPSSLRRTSR